MEQVPRNAEAVQRLLVIYRRLKNYAKELAVIDKVLDAHTQRGKAAQDKWIAAHPGAAKLGKAFLRSLGGEEVTGYGSNPVVEQLIKRRAVVEKKMGGSKGRKVAPRKKAPDQGVKAATKTKREAAESKRREAEVRKAERRIATAAAKTTKEAAKTTKEAAKAAKEAEKAAKEAAKAAKKSETEKNAKPSLFVISLRYLVSLAKIDATVQKHVAFLDKYFTDGVFLVAGRQVPRTGGVIIARANDRAAVERIMKGDPFIKGKLARVDIVEFRASKISKKRPGI
jgi:uncharacterized protein YciI